MSIRVIGSIENKKTLRRITNLFRVFREKQRHALYEIGQEHIKYIEDLMAEKKTGRIYKIKGIEHQAASPGEAPAIRSGVLKRSLYYKVHGYNFLEFGAKATYAVYLEPVYPFLRRAAEDKERETYVTLLSYNIEAFKV